jgi:chemotaxis protein CheD
MANNGSQRKRIHVIQGEYQIVTDPDVVLSTVLGSCVAACLRDPEAGVGGMNHFLLPGEIPGAGKGRRCGEAERYGTNLMELLINGLLKRGARRDRLEGKLFGGARMLAGLTDIGYQNASFARAFLANESIRLVAEHLGGTQGRRVEFFPVSGRARQILLPDSSSSAAFQVAPPPRSETIGSLEFF